ncbi:PD-(D/E)XK motif protein [Nocardia higoensis]|uniref:PD-(D/E)XK motif protein n=1 Tax=Nocardia higoensis TaxID=228599 RepID=UPI000593D0C9|nr:PD-(D/E)XK motif protein [Nocardia higoensis]
MVSALRDVLDDQWQRLESSVPQSSSVLRVTELPVSTRYGSLMAATDADGFRHLLIAVDPHQAVRKFPDGPVLRLRKRTLEDDEARRTYADLVCLRKDLDHTFTTLCADVLLATEASPTSPMKALNAVLARWKALIQNPGPPLGPQQLAGLFGELLILRRLLERDNAAHQLWRGPQGYKHDFSGDATAIEVKTSTSRTGRYVRVHGLDQLEPPTGGMLDVVWLRLGTAVDQGIGVADLVEHVLELCDDECALLDLLAAAGLHLADLEHYRLKRFTIDEERWYRVDVGFPRLTTVDLAVASVSANVRDVDYTIDLSGDSPQAMDDGLVERHLEALLQELV